MTEVVLEIPQHFFTLISIAVVLYSLAYFIEMVLKSIDTYYKHKYKEE